MPTTTTTYSFNKPVVGADEDDWGGYLNGNWDSVDDLLDGTTPVTGIDINSGTIDNVVIGGATPAAITGTTITGTSFVSSGNMTFGDNDKAIFGAGSDLQIYHDAANSFIEESGTGNLIVAGSTEVKIRNTTGGANLAVFKSGAVDLYASGTKRLATTSTGVDITGTLTSDGLTVDGDATISSGSPTLNLTDTGGVGTATINANLSNIYYTTPSSGRGHYFKTNAGSNDVLSITGGGDISFYDSAGSSQSFFWDASAESLGIGTSSPTGRLTVDGGSIHLGNNGEGIIFGSDTNVNNLIFGNAASNFIGLQTNGSEAARIDSSGNLLVGKTSANYADVGAQILSTGIGEFTASSVQPLTLRRNTSDGDIVKFYKDASTVGSIGTNGGDPYFASGSVGLKLTTEVLPVDNNGASADGFLDLGGASDRFNNLYLSGGVYLGGTGSANKLDDYETGTWTPTLVASTTNPTVTYSGNRYGSYVKVGNLVTINCYMDTTAFSGGSGNLQVGNLPFASTTATTLYQAAGSCSFARDIGTTASIVRIGKGVSVVEFIKASDGTSLTSTSDVTGSPDLHFTITYRTD